MAAALLALGQGAHASHGSAAVLHQLSLLRVPEVIQVSVPTGPTRRRAGVHVRVAGLPAGHRMRTPDGLACTTLGRTVVDLARTAPFKDAVVAADSALHSGRVTVPELSGHLEEQWGWPGSRRAQRVLTFAESRTESPGESLTRVLLTELGYAVVEPQAVVRGLSGRAYRVDFLLGRVVVEFDGKVKYADESMRGTRTPTEVVLAEKR
ncbi:hypothetical protein, partial [Motilibacter deserti]